MTDDTDDTKLKPDGQDGQDNDDNHKIPTVEEVIEGGEDAPQFDAPIASPSVTGEGDVFSGDAPEGEPADIDDEMKKAGLEKQGYEDPDSF